MGSGVFRQSMKDHTYFAKNDDIENSIHFQIIFLAFTLKARHAVLFSFMHLPFYSVMDQTIYALSLVYIESVFLQ